MAPIFAQSNPPTPPVVAAWIRCVKDAIAQERPRLLHEAFMTNVERVFKRRPYPALHLEMRQLKHLSAARNVVEREMGDDWNGLNEMMVAYLWLMEAAEPNIMKQSRPGFQEETRHYFERLKEFMGAVNSAFNSPRGAIIARTAMMTAKWCLLVGDSVDMIFGDRFFKASESLLNLLLKTFNISVAERAPYTQSDQILKKTVTIDLANYLFKLYNKTCQTKLAGTIRQNLGSVGLRLEYPLFRNPTICTYYYYRGIELMRELAFPEAQQALQESYDVCHPRYLKHRRKILIPLLTCSLLVGRFPAYEIIGRPEAQGLDELFIPLCRAIQKGDFRGYRMAMGIEGPNKWKAAWWEQQRLDRLLMDRTNILLWRSLIRKIWILTCSPEQKQHIIRIDDIWACAEALHKKAPEDIDQAEANLLSARPGVDPWGVSDPTTWWFNGLRLGKDQVEGVVMSLLDQKLIRGYLVRQPRDESTLLVLGKVDPFPNIWKLCAPRETQKMALLQPGDMGGGRVVRMNGVKEIGQS